MAIPLSCSNRVESPDAASARTVSVNEIETAQFIASSTSFTVGQNFTPDDPRPPLPVKSYKVLNTAVCAICVTGA